MTPPFMDMLMERTGRRVALYSDHALETVELGIAGLAGRTGRGLPLVFHGSSRLYGPEHPLLEDLPATATALTVIVDQSGARAGGRDGLAPVHGVPPWPGDDRMVVYFGGQDANGVYVVRRAGVDGRGRLQSHAFWSYDRETARIAAMWVAAFLKGAPAVADRWSAILSLLSAREGAERRPAAFAARG